MASRIERAIQQRDAEALRKALEKSKSADEEIGMALFDAVLGSDQSTLEFLLDALHPPIEAILMHLVSDDKVLRLLVAHGGDINALPDTEVERATPLHTAAAMGRSGVIPVLVELGAEVNGRDLYGRTPLMVLVASIHALCIQNESLKLLAEMGAKVYGERGTADPEQSLQLLLESGADASLTDHYGNDAIMYYESDISRSDAKPDPWVIDILTKAGAPGSGPTGRLFEAIRKDDVTAVRKAIAEGADVNRVAPTHDGPTPLIAASQSTESVQALLESGADPNKPGLSGTPLIQAARSGHLPVVKQLIAAGADIEMLEPEQPGDEERVRRNAYLAAEIGREHEVLDYLKSLGSGRPKPKKWKPIEPGVGSWNDFSEILVKADVGRTADALAKIIGGTVEMNAYGRSFTLGKRAYVVVRPKGMNWTNVFQVAPPMLRWPDEKESAKFAKGLAQAAGTSVMTVEYSDTSDATSIQCYEPGRSVTVDDGWDDDAVQEMADAMEDLGEEVPDWARERLAKADPENPKPRGTERLVTLAETEKFAVAHFGAYCEPGRPCDVEFTGYPAEAFDGVAFVSN